MVKVKKNRSNHREVEFLDVLRRLGGSARNVSLANALDVSEETIRRTAKALAKSGHVERVHGGVYLPNTEAGTSVFSRLGRRSAEKSEIAAATADQVPNGSSVFLDVGSTTAFVAEALRGHNKLTVVTNSLTAAQRLVNRNGNRVFLAGGELQHIECGAFGEEALQFIRGFHFDTAILSVDAIDIDTGFLLNGPAESAVARCAVAQARRTIIAADQSKFGRNSSIILCKPTDVDLVVTDHQLTPEFKEKLNQWGVDCLVVAGELT